MRIYGFFQRDQWPYIFSGPTYFFVHIYAVASKPIGYKL